MNIPKQLNICHKTYKVIVDNDLGSGGDFSCRRQAIKVGGKGVSEERQFDALLHEAIEIIFVERDVRFQLAYTGCESGDYLFSFGHKEWEHIASDIADVVHQIMKVQHHKIKGKRDA